MARQEVPQTASVCMCCKKTARTQANLFQTGLMQEPGTRIIHAPDPFPHHLLSEKDGFGRVDQERVRLMKQYQIPSEGWDKAKSCKATGERDHKKKLF